MFDFVEQYFTFFEDNFEIIVENQSLIASKFTLVLAAVIITFIISLLVNLTNQSKIEKLEKKIDLLLEDRGIKQNE